MVFDLGGGTFDLSILTIADGQFIEQGKGGDMWMGGDDIDDLIRQYVYSETELENELDDLPSLIEKMESRDKNRFLGELKKKIEQAKIKLSSSDKAYIDILGLLKDEDGDIVDIDIELRREKFEQLLSPFVERTLSLSKKLIADIGFEADLIDQVILVGGSSNIPLVIKEIKQFFGEDKVLLHPKPMLAIAEGAAILAHRLSDTYECPQCGHEVAQKDILCSSCQFNLEDNLIETGLLDIVHTSSHDYFLDLEGGNNYKLAEQNTPLPFHAHFSFKLVHHEQRLAHFKFSNEVNDKQESIGDLWLTFELANTTLDKDKLPEIQLDFEVDINNLITVSAVLEGYPDINISKTLSRGGVDEQLFLELENSISKVNADDSSNDSFYTSLEFLKRSLHIAEDINQLLDPNTGNMNKSIYNKITRAHNIALDIFDRDESFIGNQNYISNFMGSFGFLLPDKDKKKVEKKMARFEEKVKTGECKEIQKARDEALDELHNYPVLGSLMDIASAEHTVSKNNDSNKVQYFNNAVQNIIESLAENNQDKTQQLLDEVLPEVYNILDNRSNEKIHIFKEIQV